MKNNLIAITGPMASGKTTLLNKLKEFNIPVFSMDQAIREATDNMNIISDAYEYFKQYGLYAYNIVRELNTYVSIGELCNPGTYHIPGDLIYTFNHKAVQEFILKTKENFIIWQKYWCEKVCNQYLELSKHNDILIVEFPMLFESGLEYHFDKIICVNTPYRERIKRFTERGFTVKDFWDREKIHYSSLWKMEHSDFIVNKNTIIDKDFIPNILNGKYQKINSYL